MRRALAVVKFLPAVVCGLLAVAWLVSLKYYVLIFFPVPLHSLHLRAAGIYVIKGQATFVCEAQDVPRMRIKVREVHPQDFESFPVGIRAYNYSGDSSSEWQCPITFLLTLLLPVAVGCFIRFRFPVWSYFAWIGVIAIELACYLR